MELIHQLNILVIDDDKLMRNVLAAMIIDNGHLPLVASGYEQALSLLNHHKVDLILMDVEMPDIDGFVLTRMIREMHSAWIPIIFLSANDSEAYLARGIDAGGDDYLTKPVKEVILAAKIRAMARIASMKDQLEILNRKLEKLTNIDSLTNVMNRRALEETLINEWAISQRQKSELSILMIDIDFFKAYNDHYGHQQGDKCLIAFAQTIKSQLNRETDRLARYGGEEFVVVLPFTSLEGAIFKANEIILALKEKQIPHQYSNVDPYITASIGVSSTRLAAESVHELVSQADIALYQAKQSGRNCCEIFEENTVIL